MKNVRIQRSTEAPMDFEWTNRVNIKPVWATSNDTDSRKRSHEELASSNPVIGTSDITPFPPNQNVPFLFQPPQSPQTPSTSSWAPPPQFSPRKAFALPSAEEVKDVEMTEVSPGTSDGSKKEVGRAVALGGLKRVYNRRHKIQSQPRRKEQPEGDSDDDRESDHESGSEIMTHNTSNHYTLNLPAQTAPRPDIPYILSGYLQFFFNLSLILLFLYLVIQFIITVQRDVENRISEYSMDIVQEIAMCALQHKNNLCATNPVPAMVQQCSNWETCMNRDPAVVGRAKVGAELVAEVVNGFVEPISWKTLIFGLTSLCFLTLFVNALLSLYRHRRQTVSTASPNSHSVYPFTSVPPFPPHHYGSIHPPGSDSTWSSSRGNDVSNYSRRRRLEDGSSVKVK